MRAVSLGIAAVSALCFGFSGPMAKFLGAAGLTPLEAVWVRMAGAGVVLLLVLAAVRPKALRIPRDRLLFFAAYAVVAVAAVQCLFFLAITRLPVGVALLIEYTSPVMVALWVRFVRHVRLPRSAYLGAIVAVAGLAVVVEVWDGLRLDAVGLLLALVASACCAGYFLMSDSFGDDVDTLGLVGWGMLGAAVALVPVSRPWDIPWSAFAGSASVGGHSLPVAGAAAWLVLIATVVAYVTGVTAVRRLSAAVGATVASMEVIAGAVIAWVLAGERLGPAQIVGGAVVLGGALLAQSATVRLPAAHDPATAVEAARV
ncbi:EamA family transporter [Microbispora corallina]|uniref:Membrane protein n=1 Tax=Microbispora corallina TaxID=83302 RepID=A0ABQ4G0L5_9ACTN|nr:EamA family transporter [Microbispora corallina]GIH40613.1 membrane protein [Microbispora corallina]